MSLLNCFVLNTSVIAKRLKRKKNLSSLWMMKCCIRTSAYTLNVPDHFVKHSIIINITVLNNRYIGSREEDFSVLHLYF